MATTINASTSSGAVITPDTSGVLQLQSNGTTIATISSTGLSTQVGAPAFSAYCSSGTTLSAGVFTKQDFQTEEFDTNNNFASSRFTPTVAGYYQINSAFSTATTPTNPTNCFIAIYKNGSNYKQGNLISAQSGVGAICVVSSLVYCNGTTDYIEIYTYSSATTTSSTGSNTVYMNGSMTRSA